MFRFMLSFEISDMLLALIICFAPAFKCTKLCTISFTYIAKMFQLIFYSYLTNVICQFQTFLEIGFALERVLAFTTKNTSMKFRYKTIIMLILAFITNLPNNLVTRTIVPFAILNSTGEIFYDLGISQYTQSSTWTTILFIIVLIRTVFLFFVIFILNIIAIYKYKQFMLKKTKLTNNKRLTPEEIETNKLEVAKNLKRGKKERSISKLLIAVSTNYLIGNLPNALGVIFLQIFGSTSIIYIYINLVGTIVGGLSHILYLFIFAAFSDVYRKALIKQFEYKSPNFY